MKTFLIQLKDKSTEKLEEMLLHEHIQHLKKLKLSGHLLMCGPFSDDSGAMLVLQANSLESVTSIIQADPFIQNAYYGSYIINEFYEANESNNYLLEHEQTCEELNRK